MRTPAALVLLMLLVLVGCSPTVSAPPSAAPPSAASPSESTAPTGSASASAEPSATAAASGEFLLTLGYRGGHCRTGSCDRTLGIDREGGVHLVAPEAQALGQLDDALFNEVREQLSLADFEALGSVPFTGECPVNFDGQELIYTFYGATGEIRLASCEVELDPGHPLFLAIESALASVAVP